MQSAELINYIENPNLMDEQSVSKLQKLVADFPYFQPAHILLSLASKKWDATVYQKSLRKTAIVVSNRSHLFNLIHKFETTLSEKIPEPQEITEKPTIKEEVKPEPLESKHELDILKAAELSIEIKQEEALVKEPPAKPDISEQVELEMGKQLISSFLEKEVLKTPELHNPVKKVETPVKFNDWLTYLKNKTEESPKTTALEPEKPIEKVTKAPEKTEPDPGLQRKQKNKAIIDRIIESSPGTIRVKEEQKFFTPDTKAKESLQDNEHLVTETLAKIYALQGNVNKAVRAYEILSARFPQKSAYFQGLIQKLKTNSK